MSPIPAGPIAFTVEVDVNATPYGDAPTWTDVTEDVVAGLDFAPVTIAKWRQDEESDLTPTQVTLSLLNTDGKYTPGVGANVRRRSRLRVSGEVASTPVYFADVYADSWEVARQGNTVWTSQLSGSDIVARMGVDTPLREVYYEEVLLDSPTAFYPLSEADGATAAADLTGANQSLAVTNSKYGAGTLTFGSDATPLVSPASCALFGSADYGVSTTHARGTYLKGSASVLPASGAFSIDGWFQISNVLPSSDSACLLNIPGTGGDGNGRGEIELLVLTSGVLVVDVFGTNPSVPLTATTGASVCDGLWHHFAITLSADGKSCSLYLDGVASTLTVGADVGWARPSGQPLLLGMRIASGFTHNPYQGDLAAVAVYPQELSAGRVQAHYHAGFDGFTGERTDERITRLLSYRTNLGSVLDAGLGTMGPATTAGQTLQAALYEAAQAEGGVVFADGQGRIVFRNRAHLYDPTPVLTLDSNEQGVSLPTTFRDDIQFMRNDVTVTRPNGADQRVVDAASVAQDGQAGASLTLNVDSDWQALQLAGWMVAQGTQEWVGCPSLTVNLKHVGTATVLAICQLQPLDVIELVNLPGPVLPESMTLMVQGAAFSLANDAQQAVLFCSPVPPLTLRADATADAYTELDAGLVIAA